MEMGTVTLERMQRRTHDMYSRYLIAYYQILKHSGDAETVDMPHNESIDEWVLAIISKASTSDLSVKQSA